jgi:hypothetical protein
VLEDSLSIWLASLPQLAPPQINAVAEVLAEKGYIKGTHPILRGIRRRRKLPVVGKDVRRAAQESQSNPDPPPIHVR